MWSVAAHAAWGGRRCVLVKAVYSPPLAGFVWHMHARPPRARPPAAQSKPGRTFQSSDQERAVICAPPSAAAAPAGG
eukprot:351395-Chlamydomonas_euryale.AAC.5